MFWQKLERSSIPFLKEADESLMTKLIMFNFKSFLMFITKIPDCFCFPIIFSFSLGFMFLNIGILGFTIVGVFLVTGLILYYLSKKIVDREVLTEYYTS